MPCSYWTSGAVLPDVVGTGINPFRPALVPTVPSPCPKPRRRRSRVRSRPSPRLARHPDSSDPTPCRLTGVSEHRVTARGPKPRATTAVRAHRRSPLVSRCTASSSLSRHHTHSLPPSCAPVAGRLTSPPSSHVGHR
jgi:hypothetical protein